MTIKMTLSKGAKKFIRITPRLSKSEAEELAHKAMRNALVEGLKSVLRRKQADITTTDALLTYHPFWIIRAQSFFEYTRKDQYRFNVPPEVQEFRISSQAFRTPEGQCTIEGESTCFENYQESAIQDALDEKGTDFARYEEYEHKSLKDLRAIRDGKVPDVNVRASYVLNTLYSKIIKPINADRVKESRVEIDRLELWLIPTYVFTICADGADKTLTVDGITGEVLKDSSLIKRLTQKYWSGDTVFDIGSEVAATFVPGAGVGMVLARKGIESIKNKKTAATRTKFRSVYEERKK